MNARLKHIAREYVTLWDIHQHLLAKHGPESAATQQAQAQWRNHARAHVADLAEIMRAAVRAKEPQSVSDTQYPGFGRFWQAWPTHTRKVDKAGCLRVWATRGLEQKAGTIIDAVELAKDSEDWTKDGGRYIPAPIVWLRRSGWEGFEGQPDTINGEPIIPPTDAQWAELQQGLKELEDGRAA